MDDIELDRLSTNAVPLYLRHLTQDTVRLSSTDGTPIEVWTLTIPDEKDTLSEWARHFRQSYCPDEEIDDLREGTGLSRTDYLLSLVFPSKDELGPSVRAGDFAELLVTDFVEHILGYWTPRLKYADKSNPNESMKGVDVVGFSCEDPSIPKTEDSMICFEVKARLSDGNYNEHLQEAIDHSGKDYGRLAYTLNKVKRLHRARGNDLGAKVVTRFQNIADRPYRLQFGAGAVLVESVYNTDEIQKSTTENHPYKSALQVLVIHGEDLMNLVHALYRRGADEA